MKISTSFAGFIKGLLIVITFAIASYLSDAAHLSGIVSPTIGIVIAGFFSMIESDLKAKSNGTTALFGSVKLKPVV